MKHFLKNHKNIFKVIVQGKEAFSFLSVLFPFEFCYPNKVFLEFIFKNE